MENELERESREEIEGNIEIELKELKSLSPLIGYNYVPSHLIKNLFSQEFTFSKEYNFMISRGQLFIRIERDLQEIARDNNAKGIFIDKKSRIEYNPYVSAVSLTARLIF